MRIEIEFNCTDEATIRIDGRECQIKRRGPMIRIEGLTRQEIEFTLGGMIAEHLMDPVISIQQADATASDETGRSDCGPDFTWSTLPPDVADEVAARL